MDKPTRVSHAGFCFIAAAALAAASLFAVGLFRIVADDQLITDPVAHCAGVSPWWMVFRSSDVGFATGCLVVALCFAGLSGVFVRAAFIQ